MLQKAVCFKSNQIKSNQKCLFHAPSSQQYGRIDLLDYIVYGGVHGGPAVADAVFMQGRECSTEDGLRQSGIYWGVVGRRSAAANLGREQREQPARTVAFESSNTV